MLNLATVLEDSARQLPDRPAVIQGDTRLTYAQVEAAASQVAAGLAARGFGPGDRIALTCPNIGYFPVVYFGILKAGATVVPLNVLLTEREIAYHLTDSGARAYFCFEGTAELPMARAGHAAFGSVPGCELFTLLPASPAGASPFPVRNYRATIRVVPVVEADRAFVEWWATFDCAEADQERWTQHFANQGFAVWLAALRASLAA